MTLCFFPARVWMIRHTPVLPLRAITFDRHKLVLEDTEIMFHPPIFNRTRQSQAASGTAIRICFKFCAISFTFFGFATIFCTSGFIHTFYYMEK